MVNVDLVLSGLKLVTVVLGLVVVWRGVNAWRRTRRRDIAVLTLAIAVMTLGAVSEGLAYRGLGWTLENSHVFEAIVTLAAFAVLVWALHA